jgi:Family of unknown function (DUF5990)
MPQELPLRITLVQPPTGVTFRLQRGKSELVPPTHSNAEQISFEFTVRIGPPQADDAPNFLGPFTQGPPQDRFVYVNSGTSAGQADSCWTRRAKVKLAGITQAMIDMVLATPGAVLEARIAGKAKDGGPAAATVPLLEGGWQVVD